MTVAGADQFGVERPRLLGLAYRMTGSYAEAEDVVQDAWLRWSGVEASSIDNPPAWLTTVVTRLSLDRLKAIDRRRADYVGEWLPEPVATGRGPAETAEVADSLTLGFLVLLDRLTPLERAVFLLAEVFAEPYAEVGAALERTPEACRQIAARARRKLDQARREPLGSGVDAGLLGDLVGAVLSGDLDGVMALLDPDVVLTSDSGSQRRAARRPVVGADRVARLVINLTHRDVEMGAMRIVELNGRPALVTDLPDGPMVVQVDQRGGRVTAVWIMMNPEKLHGIDADDALR
jgi:RNA polymerase sigma-70 factor, ECF subfamily